MLRRSFISGAMMSLITSSAYASKLDDTTNPYANSTSLLAKFARIGEYGYDDLPVRIWLSHNKRKIPVFIYMPMNKKNMCPLLFSHKEFDAPQSYDALFKHLCSHGFMVMAPCHTDSSLYPDGTDNLKNSSFEDVCKLGLLPRLDDMQACISSLSSLRIKTGLDISERFLISGHQMGADVCSIFSGALPNIWDRKASNQIGAIQLFPHGNIFNILQDDYKKIIGPNLVCQINNGEDYLYYPYTQSSPGNRMLALTDTSNESMVMGNVSDKKGYVWLSLLTAYASTYYNKLSEGIMLLSSDQFTEESAGFIKIQSR